MVPKIDRDRTTMPRTTPKVRTTLNPSNSNCVVTILCATIRPGALYVIPMDVTSWRRLFQLSCNHKLIFNGIVDKMQDIRFAANLAIFDIGLSPAGVFIDRGFVPFSTTGTLEA